MAVTGTAIVADGLRKSFGGVHAVNGVSLEVPTGTVFGLLGVNDAGKTTIVRTLTTVLKPDAGHGIVNGLDVVEHAQSPRRSIGLAGQYAAVDENLTGRARQGPIRVVCADALISARRWSRILPCCSSTSRRRVSIRPAVLRCETSSKASSPMARPSC